MEKTTSSHLAHNFLLLTCVLIACLGMILTHTTFNDKNENNKITLIFH